MALFSPLSLFVLRILADDPDNTLALDDFALIANRLYRSSYFHNLLLSSFSAISLAHKRVFMHAQIRIRVTNSLQPLHYITQLCR